MIEKVVIINRKNRKGIVESSGVSFTDIVN